MERRKRQQDQQREVRHDALDRLEPALRQLDGLIALHHHLAAAEDAVEPAVFEVLAGSLERAQGELAESYSQLRALTAAYEAETRPA